MQLALIVARLQLHQLCAHLHLVLHQLQPGLHRLLWANPSAGSSTRKPSHNAGFSPALRLTSRLHADAAEPGDFCTSTLPGILPSIASPYSTVSAGPPHPPLPPDAPGFVPELAGGTSPTQPPAGFATLSTLPLHAELRAAAVEVLGAPSKRESLLLTVQVCLSLLTVGIMSLHGRKQCSSA